MATLTVTIPTNILDVPKPTKMVIKTEDNADVFVVPYAPKNVQFSGRLWEYSEADRVGRRSLQLRSKPQTPTMSFDLKLAGKQYPNFQGVSDQTGRLYQLQRIMSGTKRIIIGHVKYFSNGYWRAKSMDIDTEELNPDNSIKSCTVSCEFVMAEDYAKAKGPTSGGVKPATVSTTAARAKTVAASKASASTSVLNKSKTGYSSSSYVIGKTGSKKSASVRYHKVKKGDNLTKIAIKYYSNALMWRKIADKNKIKNPKKLKVGKKLRLP